MSAPQPLAPLSGGRLVVTALALGLASFMSVVDTTIANVSIPTISGNLGVGTEEGEWAITSFAVTNAIFIPLTGWLSRRFGQVRLFLGAVAAFTFASVLCGLAWTFDQLLIFRVLQGAVAGPIVPLSQALLVAVFPPDKRTLALSMWGMTNMAGPVAGPLLGGWITDNFSWPWIFFVNAPVGLFVVLVPAVMLRGRDSATAKLPIDLPGLVLLAVGVGCLQLMLDRGRTLDWFASPFICTMAVLAAVGLVALVIWELGAAHPIVDLRLFSYRNFAAGTAALGAGFGLYFAFLVLVPLWLQTSLGYTATWAGLATAPMGVFGVILAPFIGRWVTRHDPRLFATVALLVWAMVNIWRSELVAAVDVGTIAWMQLGQGLGIALFLIPIVSLSLAGMPADRIASATGLQNAIRMLSGSLMASLVQTLWDRRARLHEGHLVERLHPHHPETAAAIDSLGHAGAVGEQGWAILARMLNLEAHMLAIDDLFRLSAFSYLAILGLVWLARPPARP
jgi:DHA2 family multidrug resistance protein